MIYKSQFSFLNCDLYIIYTSLYIKMDPYGFVVQGHILCLIYQNIISACVTAG